MAPAELAACTSGGHRMPAAAQLAKTASKAAELGGRGRVGRARRPRPGGCSRRGASAGLGDDRAGPAPTASSGRGADAVHAGVDLEVDGQRARRRTASAARASASIARRRVHGQLAAGGATRDRPSTSGGGSDSTRIGRVDAGGAQLHALLHQGHRQARGPGAERGAGDRHRRRGRSRRPSPRPTLGRRGDAAEHSRTLWRDGVEVDLGPRQAPGRLRPRHQRGQHRGAAGRGGRRPPGRARGPRRRGRPCTHAPAAAASNGSTPWASSAPMMPDEHVTGPGRGQPRVAVGHEQDGPGRVGHDRRRPLQEHDGAGRAARRRAAAIRSAPGGAPRERRTRRRGA